MSLLNTRNWSGNHEKQAFAPLIKGERGIYSLPGYR
jgi:hypothetical protein